MQTIENLEFFENLLLKKKEEVLKILSNLRKEFQEINGCDIKEDSDFASCSTNSENNYLIYQQQLKELQEINEALEAIKTNEYGICKMCEEPINPERLKIKPFAKYCIDCREIIEKENF
jgi:DnaK suppressor protein